MSAYGFEKGFIVEHDNTLKKGIDCKDCVFYEKEDRSCTKRGLYLPEDGYNSWKRCDCFSLRDDAPNYDAKKTKLIQMGKQVSVSSDMLATADKTFVSQSVNKNEKKLYVKKTWSQGKEYYEIRANYKYVYWIPCKEVRSKQEAVKIVVEELKRIRKI